jgi:hypothetical protein
LLAVSHMVGVPSPTHCPCGRVLSPITIVRETSRAFESSSQYVGSAELPDMSL